jgi:nucleoside phosphorylase
MSFAHAVQVKRSTLSVYADVAILYALEEESDYFEEIFGVQLSPDSDEKTGRVFQLFSVIPPKGLPYKCVTAFVGSMGPQDAALLTTLLLQKYKPRTIVLVGIAGSLDSDVLVGDVVVADAVEDYLQDGRLEDGLFKPAGRVYRPHVRLTNTSRYLRVAHRNVWERIEKAACADAMEALDSIRPAGNQKLLASIIRSDSFVSKTGHLASGPVVGASSAFAQWLKTLDRKFLALEMESAGVMNAVYQGAGDERTLIIRGISDLTDERKALLDKAGGGVFRGLAMRNALRLVIAFFEGGEFERNNGSSTSGNQPSSVAQNSSSGARDIIVAERSIFEDTKTGDISGEKISGSAPQHHSAGNIEVLKEGIVRRSCIGDISGINIKGTDQPE